jgi:hypothetical protein
MTTTTTTKGKGKRTNNKTTTTTVITVKETDEHKAARLEKAEQEKEQQELEARRNPSIFSLDLGYARQFYANYLNTGKTNRRGFSGMGKVMLQFKENWTFKTGKVCPNKEFKAFRDENFPRLDPVTGSYCMALYEEFTLIDAWAEKNAPALHNPKHLVPAYRKAQKATKATTKDETSAANHQELEKAEKDLMETLYKRFLVDSEKLYKYLSEKKEQDKARLAFIKNRCADLSKAAETALITK